MEVFFFFFFFFTEVQVSTELYDIELLIKWCASFAKWLALDEPVTICLCLTNRTESLYREDKYLLASCNTICDCPRTSWDPVCGENGLTYVSPCLAGCRTSRGSGMDTVSAASEPGAWFWNNGMCLLSRPVPSKNASHIVLCFVCFSQHSLRGVHNLFFFSSKATLNFWSFLRLFFPRLGSVLSKHGGVS